jgi:hypothetical protein
MDEFLTMDQIKARYAPDWVIIAEPQTDDQLEVVRGQVVFHSPDADECWHKAREMNLDRVAVRYLGEYPEHMALNIWGDGLISFPDDDDAGVTLTMDEIKARYAPDWVLIAEPQIDDQLEVVRGRVVLHGPDRDELLRKVADLRLARIAIHHLGEHPEQSVTRFLFGEMTTLGWQADMDEVLTTEEIQARYAPDWVLIAEPQTDEMQRLLRGRVIFHSPDRAAVWDKVGELNLDRVAVRYLGEYPEHMVFGL